MVAARGTPDEALVAAWASGDERAFDALYERYSGRVTGYAWRLLGRREDAEEVCVETFTRIVERRWRDEGSFRAWLFTVAHRCCLERLRRRNLTARVLSLFGTVPLPPPECPEDGLLQNERERKLHLAIGQLPLEHRATLLLACVQELPAREVGSVLGLTEQQVRSQLSYARKLLRQELTPFHSEDTP